jgi:ubiquinone/menaquinone biosynthesis C-methylase UbiE
MGYYDLFAPFYDGSVEAHYVTQRAAALAALDVQPGDRVLDLPCGTGLSFDGLVAAGAGRVVGVDFAGGMVKQARKRVEAKGWGAVDVLQGDARTLEFDAIGGPVDRLLICLGLSCFPDWEQAFENLWGLLKPGGRCAILDIHADPRGFYGLVAVLAARADVRRRTWEPLEQRGEGFARIDVESAPLHGGQVFVASGTKPG